MPVEIFGANLIDVCNVLVLDGAPQIVRLDFAGRNENGTLFEILVHMEPGACREALKKLGGEKRFRFCPWCGEELR